jgi:hypothetical protein
VDYPVAVALESGAQGMFSLWENPAAGLRRQGGIRRQRFALARFDIDPVT